MFSLFVGLFVSRITTKHLDGFDEIWWDDRTVIEEQSISFCD